MPVAPEAALTGEQRAILDLVVGRGLDHAQIARRTGLDETVVRARATDALAALSGTHPGDAVAAYLLGTATAEQEHAAEAVLAASGAARAQAAQIAAALTAVWPAYVAPHPPGRRRRAVAPAPALAAAAAAAVIVVLLLTGVLTGGDDAPPRPARAGTADVDAVRIALRSVDGTPAGGTATFRLSARYAASLDLRLTRLGAPPSGRVAMLWADDGTGRGLPLPATLAPDAAGTFRQRYALSPPLVVVLQRSRAIEVLQVTAGQLRRLQRAMAGLEGAPGRAQRLPARPGVVVLRGAVPRG